jgi:hypothetical protein
MHAQRCLRSGVARWNSTWRTCGHAFRVVKLFILKVDITSYHSVKFDLFTLVAESGS